MPAQRTRRRLRCPWRLAILSQVPDPVRLWSRMPAIKHILFPLDFSAAGMAAIPYVRALANQFYARVSVLSVVPPAWVTPPGLIPPTTGTDPAGLQTALQTHLDQLEFDGLQSPVERVTMLGDPAEKIA